MYQTWYWVPSTQIGLIPIGTRLDTCVSGIQIGVDVSIKTNDVSVLCL